MHKNHKMKVWLPYPTLLCYYSDQYRKFNNIKMSGTTIKNKQKGQVLLRKNEESHKSAHTYFPNTAKNSIQMNSYKKT